MIKGSETFWENLEAKEGILNTEIIPSQMLTPDLAPVNSDPIESFKEDSFVDKLGELLANI